VRAEEGGVRQGGDKGPPKAEKGLKSIPWASPCAHGRGLGEKKLPVSMSSVDVALEGAMRPSQYIDTLTDTQNEPAALAIDAGVSDLKVLYHDGKVALPVTSASKPRLACTEGCT